jgi:dTDP-4-amino-4,6-dideoxygalactose transaminase
MKWKVLLSDITFDQEEREAVAKVLQSRWLSLGPVTEEFEHAMCEALGCTYAVATSSGTAALHLALLASGIKSGCDVLVPALTFVATVNAILYCHAAPIFCDIVDPLEPTISPEEVQRKVSEKTAAILVVHYAGFPCRMAALEKVLSPSESSGSRARDAKDHIIEDAAHASGATAPDGRSLGTIGTAGALSFFANKNLVTGEGGMLLTSNAEIAKTARLLRSHGMTSGTWQRQVKGFSDYDMTMLGFNYRPSEIISAIGLVQLKKLAANNARRKTLSLYYRDLLRQADEVQVPFAGGGDLGSPAYHIFPILLADELTRNRVSLRLQQAGIQTSHHYPLAHQFSYYRTRLPDPPPSLPISEAYSRRQLTLPLHPLLREEDVEWVVREIKEALTRS